MFPRSTPLLATIVLAVTLTGSLVTATTAQPAAFPARHFPPAGAGADGRASAARARSGPRVRGIGSATVPLGGRRGASPRAINSTASPLSSGFTYQGSLADGGAPANGQYDLQIGLWDADSGGSQIGPTLTLANTTVTNGLFTVTLDFGSGAFTGDARWLEIAVRKSSSGTDYTTLSPRQPLTATPYALSLRPGAVISGSVTSGAALAVGNGSLGASYGNVGIYGESSYWDGVQGKTSASRASGVAGLNTGSGNGVYGGSANGIGVVGQSNSITAATSSDGVYGTSQAFDGVHGQVNNTHSGVSGYNEGSGLGMWGGSANGIGVYGVSFGSGDGVQGKAGAGQNGVAGYNWAGGNGLYGNSAAGVGIYGTSGSYVGIVGESSAWDGVQGKTSSNGSGVAGINSGNGSGVYGVSTGGDGVQGHAGDNRSGVAGFNSGNGPGVYGNSPGGNGVQGDASNGRSGVAGYNTGAGQGVYGNSTGGVGVYGTSAVTDAVQGHAGGNGAGVAGYNSAYGSGVSGTGTRGAGVTGSSASGVGVYAYSGSNDGVTAFTASGEWAVAGMGFGSRSGGVYGSAHANCNISCPPGVLGVNTGNGGNGVEGYSGGGSTSSGVRGESYAGTGVSGTSIRGVGVAGTSTVTGVVGTSSGDYAGIAGTSTGTFGRGVTGQSTGTSSIGVYGTSTGNAGVGVSGTNYSGGIGAAGGSSSGYGVYGNSSTNAGVYGNSSTGPGTVGASSSVTGVVGTSTSGVGVYGTSAVTDAVQGQSTSRFGGAGVTGYNTHTGGTGVHGRGGTFGIGVLGEAGPSGTGVSGVASGSGLGTAGVSGQNDGGYGVFGSSKTGIGVYGQTTSVTGTGVYGFGPTAGYFQGNVTVNGNLNVTGNVSKAGGSFKIDDPQDPAHKYLVHSFVESPDMMDIYNGNVTTDAHGRATVLLPSYFEALNGDFRYQLTVIGQFAQAIVGQEIHHSRFIILTDKPHVRVSWQVTGIRHDPYALAHPMQAVVVKPAAEQGTYLHPELYRQPTTRGTYARYEHRVVSQRMSRGRNGIAGRAHVQRRRSLRHLSSR